MRMGDQEEMEEGDMGADDRPVCRCLLVAEVRAVAEVRPDVVGHEGDRDHDLVEAVTAQEVDDVFHHRLVGQRHHRLGQVRGERAQAGALAARHDDRLGEAMAYRALAMLADSQHPGSGERYLKHAMMSAEARQSPHETAKNQFLRGTLALQHHQHDRAAFYLDQALSSFQAMNMTWNEQQALLMLQKCAASA